MEENKLGSNKKKHKKSSYSINKKINKIYENEPIMLENEVISVNGHGKEPHHKKHMISDSLRYDQDTMHMTISTTKKDDESS